MERPKNITDQQWQTAVDIYNSAKRQGDKYPELTVAQAALETGWFKKPSGKNNYFGQKATAKQSGTVLRTTEVAGNRAYKTNDKFRDYNTIDEAVSDRIKKWGSKYQDAGNVEEAISRIWKYDSKKGQGVGYATDPEYGSKVKSILGTLGTAGLSSESNQTQEAGYVGMLPNGLPDVYGQPYVAEEETKTETTEAPKRTDNANKLGFVADYEELSKQYEQQLQAQQKPILQQEIIEGVQYQPLQQNFQEGGNYQDARYITVDDGSGNKREILTSSQEYRDLYNQKRIGIKNDDGSISVNPLNEVVVTPQDKNYPYYQNLSTEEKKYFNSDSPIGRAIRSKAADGVGFNADKATDFAMGWLRDLPLAAIQAPQSALVEGIEGFRGNDYNLLDAITPGEQRLPSDVWGIENDYYGVNPLNPMLPPINYKTVGNTAMDIVVDPALVTGATSLIKKPMQRVLRQTRNVVDDIPSQVDNFLPDIPVELTLDVNTPTINLNRVSSKIKKQRPDYGATDIGNDLTLYNNPSRVSDESSILGKKMAIKSVRDNSSKKSIELKTFIDEEGELKYYMSADMPNRVKAGRAFLELDKHIPIGAKIQEPGSLSFDSLLNVAKQSKSPKFEKGISGTVQLNDNAVFNRIKNSGDSNLGREYYTTAEKAREGVNEVNALLEKYNLPSAEVKQVLKQDGTPSKVFSIHVPNVVLKKLYGILGISTAGTVLSTQEQEPPKYQLGGIKIDPQGYWNPNNEGKPVIIPSPEITMRGVNYPIYGKSLETGEVKLMTPNNEYFFANTQNVLEQPINFQIGGEFVEIDRGNGKIEKINTDSDEYRALYEEGRVLGREGDTLVNPTEFNEVTVTAFRKTKPESLEPKVQIDEQELQQRLDNPYNFETKKDGTAIIKEEVLPGIKAGQETLDVEGIKELDKKITKEKAIELQTELYKMGYDLGGFGKNKDGIDGIIGDKTKKALEEYKKTKSPPKGKLTLEQEERIKRYKTPDTDSKGEALDFISGNIKEHVVNPIKKSVSEILPESLQYEPNLETVSKYDQTGGKNYLLDNKSIADIRKEKNISFLQISDKGLSGNSAIPLKLKERVVNSVNPQGYAPDYHINEEGDIKFDFFERFKNDKTKTEQVKRLEGVKGDVREDIFRMYSGLPQKYDTFTISSFKAGKDSDTNVTFKNPNDVADYVKIAATHTDLFKKLANGEITPETIARDKTSSKKGGDKINKAGFRDPKNAMWNATFGVDFDKAGNPYLSFYDNWDLKGKDDVIGIKDVFGKPIEIYDRIPLTKELINAMAKLNFKEDDKGASDAIPTDDKSLEKLTKIIKEDPTLRKEYEKLLDVIKQRYK